jgi:hypothetical protein
MCHTLRLGAWRCQQGLAPGLGEHGSGWRWAARSSGALRPGTWGHPMAVGGSITTGGAAAAGHAVAREVTDAMRGAAPAVWSEARTMADGAGVASWRDGIDVPKDSTPLRPALARETAWTAAMQHGARQAFGGGTTPLRGDTGSGRMGAAAGDGAMADAADAPAWTARGSPLSWRCAERPLIPGRGKERDACRLLRRPFRVRSHLRHRRGAAGPVATLAAEAESGQRVCRSRAERRRLAFRLRSRPGPIGIGQCQTPRRATSLLSPSRRPGRRRCGVLGDLGPGLGQGPHRRGAAAQQRRHMARAARRLPRAATAGRGATARGLPGLRARCSRHMSREEGCTCSASSAVAQRVAPRQARMAAPTSGSAARSRGPPRRGGRGPRALGKKKPCRSNTCSCPRGSAGSPGRGTGPGRGRALRATPTAARAGPRQPRTSSSVGAPRPSTSSTSRRTGACSRRGVGTAPAPRSRPGRHRAVGERGLRPAPGLHPAAAPTPVAARTGDEPAVR